MPTRRSEAAVALIRRESDGQTLWLAQWNRKWQAYHFVAGHRRPDETFRECLVRELGEELGLRADVDCTAAAEPLARVEYSAWSESARAETQYTMELFAVELTSAARASADEDPRNRWLSGPEIASQRCQDGRPVSATMQRLLNEVRGHLD